MKNKTIFIFCFLGLFVSACSPYKRSFNCPHPQGKPCTSLSRIHELIDQGEFEKLEKPNPHCNACSNVSHQSVPALIIHETQEHTVMLQAPASPVKVST